MRIAVLVPCFNEEAAVGRVVADFRRHLPDASVYVYDNNSTDRTREAAAAAGAVVRGESHRGKGNVVRRMFADVDADVYVLVDGDATYDASAAPAMVERLVAETLDMVVAARDEVDTAAYRAGHRLGNRLLTGAVAWLFGDVFDDMLSGYRVFSRRYVRSFPALSTGFETETELTVHALTLRMPIAEVRAQYFARPEGSSSKLNTFRDGARILATIANLLRRERPLLFFGVTGALLLAAAAAFGAPVRAHLPADGARPASAHLGRRRQPGPARLPELRRRADPRQRRPGTARGQATRLPAPRSRRRPRRGAEPPCEDAAGAQAHARRPGPATVDRGSLPRRASPRHVQASPRRGPSGRLRPDDRGAWIVFNPQHSRAAWPCSGRGDAPGGWRQVSRPETPRPLAGVRVRQGRFGSVTKRLQQLRRLLAPS